MRTASHELCLIFVEWVWEHAVPRTDNGAFHQILQLADVAWPGVPLEGSHGFRRNGIDPFSHAVAEGVHEMRDKRGDVFSAFSERRQQNGEDVQTIEQITAKLPASYHLDQIPIGRGYQPDIHFVRATAP